ncbi:TonB-dependent receptor [Rhodohalobacter halophilus]|uniref:TonB-dependent receptor n=1 Tax=Rhodohalobacter halophilus TaxID=1812810 RepID=UPI000A00E0B0|nr:TonB-dependent receptor [Rhodohalobacter halophilus]
MKYFITILFSMLLAVSAYAQKGTLTGTVVDEETGEEMIGVNIFVPSASDGGVTDVTGKYNIRLDPGSYTVEFSYITHQKKIVEDVEIRSGEVTQLDITLAQSSQELDEVVVSARRIDNNEVSLLRLQKRSLPVQDGISSEEINRIGFSNSAESVRQVTGASVEGGKFIVMRGLGDRYSISSMDGIVLPTTNPYRNSASLDLIPSSMVDNIVVKKTFSPDLPGNFTGGAVDITTKSLPDRYYLRLNTSISFNDQTTFNNNFLTDPINNSLSRLGYDDGSRKRNSDWADNEYLNRLNFYLIQIQNNNLSDQQIQGFNSTMQSFSERPFHVNPRTPGLDHSLNVSFGNRHFFGDTQLGYNVGINYSKSYSQYDEREINNYSARIPDGSGSRMQEFQLNRGSESIDEVNNGLIGSVTLQLNPTNEITTTSIYNNNATESVLDMQNGAYPGALSSGSYNNRVISFVQRELFNNQLKGRHTFDNLEVKWSGNYILSSQYEPNTRFIGSPVDTQGRYFYVREVQLPFHFFRDLNDTQYNAKLDVEYKFSNRFSVKTGGFYTQKDREFNEYRYQLENNGTNASNPEFLSFGEASGDFANYFSANNTGILGRNSEGDLILGLTYRDQTRPENSYTGTEGISAGYLMGVWDVTDRLKLFGGVRIEHTDFSVLSGSRNEALREGSINEVDVLPSMNLIFALNEDSNLRLSGSQTLARPNMRELAPFASFDLLGGFPIVGNPNIDRTNVMNFDVRYEIFPSAGELFALSAFYKDFTNPIVMELDVATDQPQYQYINTNNGLLYGFEVEFRKQLGFIASALENVKFSTNFTYTNSRVDLSEREFETRELLDSSIKSYRPFPYQSPYLINMMLVYENSETGWDAALYANMAGKRLAANGAGAAPDVYEVNGKLDNNGRVKSEIPTPDMSFRVQKTFLNRLSAALSVSNLLDYSVVQYQKDADQYFTNSALNPGRTFKLSVTYRIN